MGPVTVDRDPVAIGRTETELWSECLRRLIEFRARNQSRFFDVSFREMQDDPLGAMARLYHDMGEVLTHETETQMEDWWSESSKDRRQGSAPDAATFGLHVSALRAEFASYYERFGDVLGQ
jgi:hypothetical protein